MFLQIVFEAVKLKEGNSSLSLDDLKLVPSPCPALGSCDFSSDTCGYSLSAQDPILWLVGNGKTHNPNITLGPDKDAMDSIGMYAYMDFTMDGLKNNDIGRMISPPVPATDSTCFSFWVNIFGNKPGQILVQKVGNEKIKLINYIVSLRGI